MDMVQLIHYTENSVLFFQYVYSNGALLVTSPAGKVAKYCDEYVVCVSVCPRGYLRNHTRDLYQIFVHVAYVRGSVIIRKLTIGRITGRRKRVTGVQRTGEV